MHPVSKKNYFPLVAAVSAGITLLILFALLGSPATPTNGQPDHTNEIALALDTSGRYHADFILNDTYASENASAEKSRGYSYSSDVVPLLERTVAPSDAYSCSYGLYRIQETAFALFHAEATTRSEAEKLAHLLRCYVDYYPVVVYGNLSEQATTLLENIVGLKSVYKESFSISYANLTFDTAHENLLLATVEPTPKQLDLTRPMIALTFDDGPSVYTETALAALKQYDAKATFFMLGVQIEAYPDVVRALFKAGCEIGNHTNLHEVFSSNTRGIIQKTIDEADRKLRDVIGIGSALLRPPTGAVNDRSGNRVSTDRPIILWSIDTRDFESELTEAELLRSVLPYLTDGAIVLMHDTHETTVLALGGLLNGVASAGYQLVSVSELLEFKLGGATADTVYKGCADE